MPVIVIDRHLTPEDVAAALRADVRAGLTSNPKELPPKWFYDARGSELFEQITQLDEYYPTRAERAILTARASAIAAASGADTLVELGAGSAEKTRLLLDAMTSTGRLTRYVPVDVSGDALEAAAERLAVEYPELRLHIVVADFDRHLRLLPAEGNRLIAFLGGTIANYPPGPRRAFLAGLRDLLTPGEGLLLGTDLVKDTGRLLRAYDDERGVTAEFNRNVLHVINRELAADFDPAAFAHVAVWDPVEEWIEMRLRSRRDQTVTVGELDLTVSFAAGEQMRTEISAKFRPDGVKAELAAAGFTVRDWWTDPAGDYALWLAEAA